MTKLSLRSVSTLQWKRFLFNQINFPSISVNQTQPVWTKLASVKTKKQKKMSATQRGSKHDNMMNERRKQPNAGQKKEEHIGRFKSFLSRGINTVTYTIVTVHTICERALFS